MDAERKQGDKGNVKTHSYLRKPLQKITVTIYNYKTDLNFFVHRRIKKQISCQLTAAGFLRTTVTVLQMLSRYCDMKI